MLIPLYFDNYTITEQPLKKTLQRVIVMNIIDKSSGILKSVQVTHKIGKNNKHNK